MPIPWIDLSRWWQTLEDLAWARHHQKRQFKSSNLWTARENTHFYGICGEAVIAMKAGLRVDRNLRVNGDPGFDFCVAGVTYDVKTSTFIRSPDLKEFPNKDKHPDIYILVALDDEQRRARIVGWATAHQVKNADLKDYGHGPMLHLTENNLQSLNQSGLPPQLLGEFHMDREITYAHPTND